MSEADSEKTRRVLLEEASNSAGGEPTVPTAARLTPVLEPVAGSNAQSAPAGEADKSANPDTTVTGEAFENLRAVSNAQPRNQTESYEPIDERELNRLRDLYEEPRDVRDFLEESRAGGEIKWKKPVLMLIGKQRTGKMSAALHISARSRAT